MRKSYFLLCLTLALTACERDINLEDYRSIEGSDLLTLNAVVAAEQQVARMPQLRRQRALYQAHLRGQAFQSPQRAFGLVKVVYLILYVR